jgi:hypothetical protein
MMSVQNGLGFHLRRCGCDGEGVVGQAARWLDRRVRGALRDQSNLSVRPELRWFWSIILYVDPKLGIETNGRTATIEEAKARFPRQLGKMPQRPHLAKARARCAEYALDWTAAAHSSGFRFG